MENEKNKKYGRACYIGMILIIIGYVSFSNHAGVGDVVILTGTLTILVSKWFKWKGRRADSNMGQSKTYSS